MIDFIRRRFRAKEPPRSQPFTGEQFKALLHIVADFRLNKRRMRGERGRWWFTEFNRGDRLFLTIVDQERRSVACVETPLASWRRISLKSDFAIVDAICDWVDGVLGDVDGLADGARYSEDPIA